MADVKVDASGDNEEGHLLRLDDIHRTFTTRSRGKKVTTYALRGISLRVVHGETVGIVGESGCGKTTLARMIAGLDEPTRGAMAFRSKKLIYTKELRKKISMVFQDPYASLNPRMSTETIVREPMHMLNDEELEKKVRNEAHKFSWRKRKSVEINYAKQLLELVQLRPEWSSRYPHEFSGGQRQRIGIARALATSPELLILDEPVSALDVSVQAGIITLLQKLRDDDDLTMIFISHDLRVVRHLCDRVVVMYLGQIMEDAPSDLLFSHPCHPYTRALIGSVPARPEETDIVETVIEESDRDFVEIANPEKEDGEKTQLPFSVISGELPSPTNPPTGCPYRTRCERAESICSTQPVLAQMTDGRTVACHFPY